jgi:hypothetical protein
MPTSGGNSDTCDDMWTRTDDHLVRHKACKWRATKVQDAENPRLRRVVVVGLVVRVEDFVDYILQEGERCAGCRAVLQVRAGSG